MGDVETGGGVSGGSERGRGDVLDGCFFAFETEVEEELSDALAAVDVFAEGVEDPGLTEADYGGNGGGLRVTRDELDIVDSGTLLKQSC